MDDALLPVVKLSDLEAQPTIADWLILGPFVVETGASFEREYMFERHLILDIDYLEAIGGERAVRPVQDQAVPNSCLGPARLQWERVRSTELRFTHRTGDLLYRTVQRNAVWYVASYVDSDRNQVAFVEAYHSGMRLFLNGELVLDQPYGQAKGLYVRQMLLPVRLQAGRNLFLAKVRPGYIADGVEFCLRNFTVRPATLVNGPVVAAPAATGYFASPHGEPRQVIEVRCANLGDRPVQATLRMGGESAEVTLAPGASDLVRLPAGTPGTESQAVLELTLEVAGRRESMPFAYVPSAAPETKGKGYVFTDFHFDTTYHEEQRVYAMGAFDIVRRYCEQLALDPLFKCTLSELDYLKPYFDMFPAHRDILRRAHLEGRAESDVFYNQPQELNCCGETFVRNMLYGQLWHEDVLGRRCYIYSPGDVFGHPAQMSQIALKGGCTGVGWDKAIFGFPPLFRHLSPDGTWAVHRRGGVDRASSLTLGLSSFLAGMDKTAPSAWTQQLAPPLQMAVPSEFHEAVKADSEQQGARLTLTSRDMSLYHAGTALSRIELKIGNRLAENMLISAEKFASLAGLLGASYPEKPLDKAWRQLLCGQHHDSITGTHNEISYVDLMVAYRESCELAQATLADALAYLNRAAAAKPGAGEIGLRLFNPHCWDRTDVCRTRVTLPAGWSRLGIRDAAGNPVPSQVLSREGDQVELAFVATVPSLGYTTYYLTGNPAVPAAETERVETATIENDAFRLVADPDRGGLTSMYDKRADRECLASGELVGGEVSALREVYGRAETQHEFYTTGQGVYGHNKPARVHALMGPVISTLVLEQELSDVLPPIRHEISLVAGVPRVDCRILLADYQYQDDLFVVTYPTSLRGAVPTFDDRYCAIARRPSRDLLDFRTHQMFMFSGCAVYPADRWMEYGPTVTLDMGEAGACTLGMTAVVSPADNSLLTPTENLITALTTKGIPVTPWPDCDQPVIGTLLANVNDDLLYNDFRFVLLTAANPNRFAEELLGAVEAGLAARYREQIAKGPAALYLVDRNNREQKPIQTVLLGAPDAQALEGAISDLAAQLGRGEAVTLPALAAAPAGPVDDYGICLVNVGNIASSVERGGVVCLPLFHTCEWYGATGNIEGRPFVPEQRTHVYTYSLFPHAGTWRQAQVYRRALEVNDPIIALAAESGDRLPETASFLSVDAPSIVVTALKAFGNPLAGSRANVDAMPARGLTLRYYEADGRPTRGTFRFLPKIRRAFAANLLEQPGDPVAHEGNHLPFACRPFSIETFGVVTEPLSDRLVAADLGPQTELVQPVFVRSWEHDAGTMPMGYETVVASLGRDVEESPDGTLKINVNVVNDYVDAPAAGEVRLVLPEGWKAETATFAYDLPALGHTTFPVTVTRPAGSSGQIKLRFVRDGQEYQDVLEVGKAIEPTFTLRLEEGRIVAAVENPGSESLECEVALASPVETWPAAVVGRLSLAEITPRTIGLSVPPGSRQEAVFTVTVDDKPVCSAWWAVGKLMANGRIYLRRVDRRGRARHWSSGDMWREMSEGKRPRMS